MNQGEGLIWVANMYPPLELLVSVIITRLASWLESRASRLVAVKSRSGNIGVVLTWVGWLRKETRAGQRWPGLAAEFGGVVLVLAGLCSMIGAF